MRLAGPARRNAATVILCAVACRGASPDARQSGATTAGASASTRVAPDSPARAAGTSAAGQPAPSATNANRGAETTGTSTVNRRCGGVFINVTLRPSALGGATDAAGRERALRDAAARIIAPVRDAVGSPELSPAIRAFRIAVRDSTQTQRIIGRLRSAADVEDASRDECSVRIR